MTQYRSKLRSVPLATRAVFLLAFLLLLIVTGYGTANAAATLTVCSAGCDFNNIQGAVNAAANGDTIKLQFNSAHTEDDIVIERSITIVGFGDATIVQAAATQGPATNRVFYISAGHTVTMRDFRIRHGKSTSGGAILNDGSHLTLMGISINNNEANSGDGISNVAGTLLMRDVVLGYNVARVGGALRNSGVVQAEDIIVKYNDGNENGGGIVNDATGELFLHDSAIFNNELKAFGFNQRGGGIYNEGKLHLVDTTVVSNRMSGGDGPPFGGGAGIYQRKGTLQISGGHFQNNRLDSFQNGTALSIEDGSARISHTRFSGGSNGTDTGILIATSGTVAISGTLIEDYWGGGLVVFSINN